MPKGETPTFRKEFKKGAALGQRVRALLEEAASEKYGPQGCGCCTNSNEYKQGRAWLEKVAAVLKEFGEPAA